MGALTRATRKEVEELYAADAEWWPDFCGELAQRGQAALREEREKRGWTWGALWKWIVGDEKRYGDYMQALEAYAQGLALETVGISDESGEARLRVDTRFKLAGKMDRVRWGDKVEVDHRGLQPVLIIEVVGEKEVGEVIDAEQI